MWYPAQAAFRTGQVGTISGGDDVWDTDSVSLTSVAFGEDTYAGGDNSVAMGSYTFATNFTFTTLGYSTHVQGAYSTAMGQNTTATGDGAMAVGSSATAAHYAVAMGGHTTAATIHSLSVGAYNSANTTVDGTLFVGGNGISTSQSDALVLDTGGNMTIAGSLTESSDRRLKNNITPNNK